MHYGCIAILNWWHRALSRADISVCHPHTTDLNWVGKLEWGRNGWKGCPPKADRSQMEWYQRWNEKATVCGLCRKKQKTEGCEYRWRWSKVKENIMKRNGQDEEKVYAQYHGRGILLLTSARLRRSLPQKDVEIPSLNTFKNRLNKPQWARLSSSYSHRAVTHSSSRPFEAWESLRAERGWAGCKAEIWSRVLQGVILHRGRHESD